MDRQTVVEALDHTISSLFSYLTSTSQSTPSPDSIVSQPHPPLTSGFISSPSPPPSALASSTYSQPPSPPTPVSSTPSRLPGWFKQKSAECPGQLPSPREETISPLSFRSVSEVDSTSTSHLISPPATDRVELTSEHVEHSEHERIRNDNDAPSDHAPLPDSQEGTRDGVGQQHDHVGDGYHALLSDHATQNDTLPTLPERGLPSQLSLVSLDKSSTSSPAPRSFSDGRTSSPASGWMATESSFGSRDRKSLVSCSGNSKTSSDIELTNLCSKGDRGVPNASCVTHDVTSLERDPTPQDSLSGGNLFTRYDSVNPVNSVLSGNVRSKYDTVNPVNRTCGENLCVTYDSTGPSHSLQGRQPGEGNGDLDHHYSEIDLYGASNATDFKDIDEGNALLPSSPSGGGEDMVIASSQSVAASSSLHQGKGV